VPPGDDDDAEPALRWCESDGAAPALSAVPWRESGGWRGLGERERPPFASRGAAASSVCCCAC
jgi:hypothetical protein